MNKWPSSAQTTRRCCPFTWTRITYDSIRPAEAPATLANEIAPIHLLLERVLKTQAHLSLRPQIFFCPAAHETHFLDDQGLKLMTSSSGQATTAFLTIKRMTSLLYHNCPLIGLWCTRRYNMTRVLTSHPKPRTDRVNRRRDLSSDFLHRGAGNMVLPILPILGLRSETRDSRIPFPKLGWRVKTVMPCTCVCVYDWLKPHKGRKTKPNECFTVEYQERGPVYVVLWLQLEDLSNTNKDRSIVLSKPQQIVDLRTTDLMTLCTMFRIFGGI